MDWQDIIIGTKTGAVEIEITNEMIAEHVATTELGANWNAGFATPDGQMLAPPDLLPRIAMRRLFVEYMHSNVGKSLRAKQAYEFLKPVFAGMTIRGAGRIAGKYEKRGMRFVELEAVFTDADGTPVCIDRRTMMLRPDNFQLKADR